MNFKTKFSGRIGMDDVHEIVRLTQQSWERKQELYDLAIGEDNKTGYQAAWIFTHFSSQDNRWLYSKQNELIDAVLVCKHAGRRRILLGLLYKQPLPDPPRVDFLDFCLERMLSTQELPGVQSLCMKIAYELCRPIPELTDEFKITLTMILQGNYSPAVRHTRKKILKAMQKGKSLQKL